MARKEFVESCRVPAKSSPGTSAALTASTFVCPPRGYASPLPCLQLPKAEVDPSMQGQ